METPRKYKATVTEIHNCEPFSSPDSALITIYLDMEPGVELSASGLEARASFDAAEVAGEVMKCKTRVVVT